jgi:hypothetical protein
MLSNLGNAKAGILEGIRNAERIHWTLGLKQAETILHEKRQILNCNFLSIRKTQREMALKSEKKKWLGRILAIAKFIPILGLSIQHRFENLADEIEIWEKSVIQDEPLIRDCAFETEIAESERDRILEAHPEALNLTYEELQELSVFALREKKLQYLIPRYWAARNNLPESVAVTLFEAGEEERDYLLSQIVKEISAQAIPDEVLEMSLTIASLPWHEKQIISGLVNASKSSNLPG